MLTQTNRTNRQNPPTRFLSQAECIALAKALSQYAVGGGRTQVAIESTWTGNTRWARNQISTSGDVRNQQVFVTREIRGAKAKVGTNQITPLELTAAARRAERLLTFAPENLESSLLREYPEQFLHPNIWSDTTYNLEAERRAQVMNEIVKPVEAAGMLSAGYIEVSAHGRAVMDDRGKSMYYPFTQAQCSLTVRDPDGTGSGWAGIDWHEWTKIDTKRLSEIALDKCLRSRNPVRIEPGRYTTILEPQAVYDLWDILIRNFLERMPNEITREPKLFAKGKGFSRLGERLLDDRVTISADPMDPELGFPPFDIEGNVFRPVEWFKNGVLTALWYDQKYAIEKLYQNDSLFNSNAFRIHGGTTLIDEMIATTKRGILVTRFSNVRVLDPASLLLRGHTRDGLWLIENGTISKAIKNFVFTESPMFAFNNLEQLGPAVRVFSPQFPAIAPAAKVRDFSFTSLIDAV